MSLSLDSSQRLLHYVVLILFRVSSCVQHRLPFNEAPSWLTTPYNTTKHVKEVKEVKVKDFGV